jgi:4a-hydroxytetrahydrobiopterin dehydratase
MKTLAQLLNSHCIALEGHPALTSTQITEQLNVLPDWQFKADFIEREYKFANYYETLAFVNALAFVVHREDHHPDLNVSYNRCGVKFNTHSVGGISLNDFICAAKADALYDARHVKAAT